MTPTRADGSETTRGWTRRRFDGAGRLVEAATFSGASQPAYDATPNSTGKITYSYSGECHTIKDQKETASANSGSARTVCADAAGRISSASEAGADHGA